MRATNAPASRERRRRRLKLARGFYGARSKQSTAPSASPPGTASSANATSASSGLPVSTRPSATSPTRRSPTTPASSRVSPRRASPSTARCSPRSRLPTPKASRPSSPRLPPPSKAEAGRFRKAPFAAPFLFLHKDTKERKGLGTSPFGPSCLTTVPIPCVSVRVAGNAHMCTEDSGGAGASLRATGGNVQWTSAYPSRACRAFRSPFSVLCSPL